MYAKHLITRAGLLLTVAMVVTGCAFGGSSGEAVNTEERVSDYQQFLDSVPSLQEQSVGNAAADLLFSGIQGLAVQQHNAFQLYASNTDGPVQGLALRLERIAAEDGEEAYISAVQELSAEDKQMYSDYLTTQQQLTSERIKMLPEAVRIIEGLRNLNPREIASNPMAVAGAAGAVKTALEQGQYVMQSLEYMQLMDERLTAAAEYVGR